MYVTIGEKTSFGRTPAARREAALLQLLTEQVTSCAEWFTQQTKIVRWEAAELLKFWYNSYIDLKKHINLYSSTHSFFFIEHFNSLNEEIVQILDELFDVSRMAAWHLRCMVESFGWIGCIRLIMLSWLKMVHVTDWNWDWSPSMSKNNSSKAKAVRFSAADSAAVEMEQAARLESLWSVRLSTTTYVYD